MILQSVFRMINFGLENRGVSFGLGQEIGKTISIFVFAVFIFWFGYEIYIKKRYLLSLYLIALGGAGNIVCRFIWGSVWDYVCFPILPFCFNLSDVLISLGVVSYILGVNGNRRTLRGQ